MHADGICFKQGTGTLCFISGTATCGNEREFQMLLGTGAAAMCGHG